MLDRLGIPFLGIVHLLAIIGAFYLGRMHERPRAKWEEGGILDFGWEAWRVPFQVIVAASALATMALPLLGGGIVGGLGGSGGRRGSGVGGGFGGGYGGGYGGRRGGGRGGGFLNF